MTGRLPTDLSEQHMLDCGYDGRYRQGCTGGRSSSYHDWLYMEHNGGLAKEGDYPYTGDTWNGEKCRNSSVANTNTGAVVRLDMGYMDYYGILMFYCFVGDWTPELL